jgi:hypothetical protein
MNGSAATTAAIAPVAEAPAAMRSSRSVPNRGSVMFCVQAAPTPAHAQAQRAATAGDDDEMAMPNWPVRAQRAAMERVTVSRKSVVESRK